MKILKLFLISAFVLSNTPSFAEPTTLDVKCWKDSSTEKRFGYCIHQVKESKNLDVLYYFHGLGGSQFDWRYAAATKKAYEIWGNQAPIVVSISYGGQWLLAERNNSPVSGLYEHFLDQAMPKIESKLAVLPAHRLLAGASQGGFNASQLYLKHPEMFTRVALACPAITTVGPFSTNEEIQDYISRTRASYRYVYAAIGVTRYTFPDEASWRYADPLTLASERVTSSYPPVFVSIGDSDQYGFFEGAKRFVELVNSKGAQAQYVEVKGGHCSFDGEALARFLIPTASL